MRLLSCDNCGRSGGIPLATHTHNGGVESSFDRACISAGPEEWLSSIRYFAFSWLCRLPKQFPIKQKSFVASWVCSFNLAQRFRVFSSHGGLSRKSYLTKTPVLRKWVHTQRHTRFSFIPSSLLLSCTCEARHFWSDVINLIRHWLRRQTEEGARRVGGGRI